MKREFFCEFHENKKFCEFYENRKVVGYDDRQCTSAQ